MKNRIARIRKALVPLVGLVGHAVVAAAADAVKSPSGREYIVAVLVAAGIYVVPNRPAES